MEGRIFGRSFCYATFFGREPSGPTRVWLVHNNNSGNALNIAINSRKLTARTTGRGNLIYFSFLIENPARTITYFPASALSLPGADIETAGYPIAIGQ